MIALLSMFGSRVLARNIYLLKILCHIFIVEGGGELTEVILLVLMSVVGTAVSLVK